jgi:two-component system response regulator FixJ
VSQSILDDLLDDVPEQRLAKVRTGLERLTPREVEVLKRAISGETASESAASLGISVRTVELHRQQVLAKLEVKNLTQAVRMIALAQRRPAPPVY